MFYCMHFKAHFYFFLCHYRQREKNNFDKFRQNNIPSKSKKIILCQKMTISFIAMLMSHFNLISYAYLPLRSQCHLSTHIFSLLYRTQCAFLLILLITLVYEFLFHIIQFFFFPFITLFNFSVVHSYTHMVFIVSKTFLCIHTYVSWSC